MEHEDWEELMQEGPVGENYGRSTSVGEVFNDDLATARRPGRSLSLRHPQVREAELMWLPDERLREQRYYGMKAHRGTLHPDEYVDTAELERLAEAHLGFTLAEMREAWRPGEPDAARYARKAAMEDRLLEIAEAGGNMTLLARIFGWKTRSSGTNKKSQNGWCRTMAKALRRARARREASAAQT